MVRFDDKVEATARKNPVKDVCCDPGTTSNNRTIYLSINEQFAMRPKASQKGNWFLSRITIIKIGCCFWKIDRQSIIKKY